MSRAADYDAQFAARFSSEDAEFQRYRQRAPDPPPVVEDWRAARGRRDRRAPEQRHHEREHEHERRGRHFPDRRNERNSYGSHGQRSHY